MIKKKIQETAKTHTVYFLVMSLLCRLEQYPCLPFFFLWHWHFWRVHMSYLVKCPTVWICLIWFRLSILGQDYTTRVILCPSRGMPSCPESRPVCPITDDAEVDHVGRCALHVVRLGFTSASTGQLFLINSDCKVLQGENWILSFWQ